MYITLKTRYTPGTKYQAISWYRPALLTAADLIFFLVVKTESCFYFNNNKCNVEVPKLVKYTFSGDDSKDRYVATVSRFSYFFYQALCHKRMQ